MAEHDLRLTATVDNDCITSTPQSKQ